MSIENPVTSPELPVNGQDIIKDAKSFSGAMTLDMTDEEIAGVLGKTLAEISDRLKPISGGIDIGR
jgi:hypothetical protein